MTLTPQDAALLRRRQAGPTSTPNGRDGRRRRRPPMRRECDIQRAILDYLKTVPGVVAWKSGGGLLPLADGRRVRMGRKGVSDIVGWRAEWVCPCEVVRGKPMFLGSSSQMFPRWLAIEVKRPGKQPTIEQAAFLTSLRQVNGIAIVASSVEDVARALGMTK